MGRAQTTAFFERCRQVYWTVAPADGSALQAFHTGDRLQRTPGCPHLLPAVAHGERPDAMRRHAAV